ncbi:MAG TPA: 16S rRNA (guanine(527)-N(7))-methyltransferase RsmG [Sediminibacterium sp.]|nr:16S rRNA (guanine(527)-N(7))-methyltransferase RsmG [Sediminibacterium sp.]
MESTPQKLELISRYFSEFTEKQWQQFAGLEALYLEWNAQINVISRKDMDAFYLHHVLHSLSIAAIAEFPAGTEVLDIGCGGGFPGIPLAIFFPEVKFLLVDSIGKKLKVVEAVCAASGIRNVQTKHCRVEEIRDRKFDYAVSRAVAPLKTLWQWASPLVKKNNKLPVAGGLICLKGGDLAQEISESGLRPKMMPVSRLFPEPYFEEKFVLHITR